MSDEETTTANRRVLPQNVRQRNRSVAEREGKAIHTLKDFFEEGDIIRVDAV
jgi:hypothetical protein